ncbi:unnamed protein product, partial [Heterosigma akashiwo]
MVQNITLRTDTSSSLRVDYTIPYENRANGNNGAAISMYKIELATRQNEIQQVYVSSGFGSYRLVLDNERTDCVDLDTSATELEVELEVLANIDGVVVTLLDQTVNSTTYSIEFDGPLLSNGDQTLLVLYSCSDNTLRSNVANSNNDTYATVSVIQDGLAGAVPQIEVITTQASTMLGGYFVANFGFIGDLSQRLSQENITALIEAGSNVVRSTADLRHYLNSGDFVLIGNYEMIVDGDFRFTVHNYHPEGANGIELYVWDTLLGNAQLTENLKTVYTDLDLTRELSPGDGVVFLNTVDQEYEEYTVDTISSTQLTLTEAYSGSTTLHASVYRKAAAVVRYDASADEMVASLVALQGIGDVNVERYGPTAQAAYTWSVTFGSFYGSLECPTCSRWTNGCNISHVADAFKVLDGNVSFVTTDSYLEGIYPDFENSTASDLVSVIEAVIHEVQVITIDAKDDTLEGNFNIQYEASGETVTVNHDIPASDLEFKLENLVAIGDLVVTRSSMFSGYGYHWTISFLTNIGDLPLFLLDGHNSSDPMVGSGWSLTANEIVKGQVFYPRGIMDGLDEGIAYSARVSVANVMGYGLDSANNGDIITRGAQNFGEGAVPGSEIASGVPDPPFISSVAPFSRSQVRMD